MGDIRSLEYPTLKVPYEVLNKNYRGTQKAIDKEISRVNNASNDLTTALANVDTSKLKVSEVNPLVDNLIECLSTLKHKVTGGVSVELENSQLLKARLQHLRIGADAQSGPEYEQWKKTRCDRMLMEYLLRANYHETATGFADASNIADLTNSSIHARARHIEESLSAHKTDAALEWCAENRSKLRRIKSNFEMLLREQEFIELIRSGSSIEAMKYAQKHFAVVFKEHMSELAPLMGLLAYTPDTRIPTYQAFFSTTRWEHLLAEFRAENYRVFQLNVQSTFSACLQAGLSALKTPACYTVSSVLESSTTNKDIKNRNNNTSSPVLMEEQGNLLVGPFMRQRSFRGGGGAASSTAAIGANFPGPGPDGMMVGAGLHNAASAAAMEAAALVGAVITPTSSNFDSFGEDSGEDSNVEPPPADCVMMDLSNPAAPNSFGDCREGSGHCGGAGGKVGCPSCGGDVDGPTNAEDDDYNGPTDLVYAMRSRLATKKCPICTIDARCLARDVPFAHFSQSRLICAQSGEILNEHNLPLALPNGMVYSQRALEAMKLPKDPNDPDGEEWVICPRTRNRFLLADAERVFVM